MVSGTRWEDQPTVVIIGAKSRLPIGTKWDELKCPDCGGAIRVVGTVVRYWPRVEDVRYECMACDYVYHLQGHFET